MPSAPQEQYTKAPRNVLGTILTLVRWASPCALLLLTTVIAGAQSSSTPSRFGQRDLNGSQGIGVGGAPVRIPSTTPKIITYTTVSPERIWTSRDGKTVKARLFAFSAPKMGEKGPVEVIRDGHIQFLLSQGKKPARFPLETLSEVDQIYVKKIADAARFDDPKKETVTEEENESDKGTRTGNKASVSGQ